MSPVPLLTHPMVWALTSADGIRMRQDDMVQSASGPPNLYTLGHFEGESYFIRNEGGTSKLKSIMYTPIDENKQRLEESI
jgi:hypothetical protein